MKFTENLKLTTISRYRLSSYNRCHDTSFYSILSTIQSLLGTNKFASQKGMSMGAVRHVADIRSDDMDRAGQGVITLQAG